MSISSQESRDRNAYFEHARFFSYIPERTIDSLTEIQRRDIAHTIFELQRSNPRVLQEIYLDNPFISQGTGSRLWRRVKRRFFLVIRSIWFTLFFSQGEKRRENRIADFIFVIIITTIVITLILSLLFSLYVIKSAAGVDLFPGIHLFCTD